MRLILPFFLIIVISFQAKSDDSCLNVNWTTQDVFCPGSNEGVIDFTVLNGTAPFTADLSSIPISMSDNHGFIFGLTAGCYTLNVFDSGGCNFLETICIFEPPSLTATVNSTDVTCSGNCDGFAEIIVSGGVAPYAFNWSNGANTSILNNLCPGMYSITITDANGCQLILSISINGPQMLLVVADSLSSSCGPGATGSAAAIATGGIGPYTYLWDNGETTVGASLLSPGIHFVTVIDGNGCTAETNTNIPEGPSLEVDLLIVDEGCQAGSGSASATVTSGTPPFLYVWSNGANTPTINGLSAGTYSLTIYDDNGCTFVSNFNIVSTIGLELNSSLTSCDAADGTASVNVLFGANNPDFAWSNGQTSQTATGLAPGWYSVTVTNLDNGCSTHQNIEVFEDPACKVIISGYVILDDANQDCTEDGTSVFLANRMVDIEPGGSTFTDANGYYEFTVDAGTYSLSVIPWSAEEVDCPVGNLIAVSATTPGSSYADNNFFLNLTSVQDLCITVCFGPARPGFSQWYYINYCNFGSHPVSGSFSFSHDEVLTNFGGATSGATYDPGTNTATWTFTDLQPNNCQTVSYSMHVPGSTTPGTILNNSAEIQPSGSDVTPNNNSQEWTQAVTASYDPNDKQNFVGDDYFGGPIFEEDSIMQYFIRFQNTGTDTAFTVVLRDTLSTHLDIETIRPIGSSHDFRLEMMDENILEIWFDNIMLPDSNVNEPGSHGYFRFDVGLKQDLPLGTEINNSAAIYFDFNPQVLTNIVSNEVSKLTGIWNPELSDISMEIIPNPAVEDALIFLNSETKSQAQILLYDQLGRQVGELFKGQIPIGESAYSLPVGHLQNGIYFVRLETRKSIITRKLIKVGK